MTRNVTSHRSRRGREVDAEEEGRGDGGKSMSNSMLALSSMIFCSLMSRWMIACRAGMPACRRCLCCWRCRLLLAWIRIWTPAHHHVSAAVLIWCETACKGCTLKASSDLSSHFPVHQRTVQYLQPRRNLCQHKNLRITASCKPTVLHLFVGFKRSCSVGTLTKPLRWNTNSV